MHSFSAIVCPIQGHGGERGVRAYRHRPGSNPSLGTLTPISNLAIPVNVSMYLDCGGDPMSTLGE